MQNAPDYIDVEQLIGWYEGDPTALANYCEVKCAVTYRISAERFINDYGRPDLDITATFVSTKWGNLELSREMVVQIIGETLVRAREHEATESCYKSMWAAA